MNDLVLIKSYNNGIRLILDDKADMEELLSDLREKITSYSKFFKGGKVALEMDGRILSEDEEKAIIRLLSEEGMMDIVCLTGKDDRDKTFVKAIKRCVPPDEAKEEVHFHNGNLVAGDYLKSDVDLVLFGNAYKGSHIEVTGNVYVMGSLMGEVICDNGYIAALSLSPEEVTIDGVTLSEKTKKLLDKHAKKKIPTRIYIGTKGDIESAVFVAEDIAHEG